MIIERLKQLTEQQFEDLGYNGYSTDQIYKVSTIQEANSLSFGFSLENLSERYTKHYQTTSSDIKEYNNIIASGDSFGVSDNGKLQAIAICAAQKWNNSMSLQLILVSENNRQKGIGALLIGKVIENARDKKIRLVELETQNTNVPAIHFYQRQGFAITGLKTKLYKDEANEIAVYMTLECSDY